MSKHKQIKFIMKIVKIQHKNILSKENLTNRINFNHKLKININTVLLINTYKKVLYKIMKSKVNQKRDWKKRKF